MPWPSRPCVSPSVARPVPTAEHSGTHYRIVRLLYREFAVPARRFEDGRARQTTSVRRGRGPRRGDAAVLGPRIRWHVDERPHGGDGDQPAQCLCRLRQQGGTVHGGAGALPRRPRSVRGQGTGPPHRPRSLALHLIAGLVTPSQATVRAIFMPST